MVKIKKNFCSSITILSLLVGSIFPHNKTLATPVVPFNLAPEGARQANRYNNTQPRDFSSLSPWGEAISTNAKSGK